MRIIIACTLLTVALAAKETVNWMRRDHKPVALRKPLVDFPVGKAGDGWTERREELDERTLKNAGVSDYLNHFYVSRKASVWFYCGYYDGARLESIHQPEACFPSAGWETESRSTEAFEIGGGRSATFNVVAFRRGVERRLTAYSFFYEGNVVAGQRQVELGRAFGDRHFAVVTLSVSAGDAAAQRSVLAAFVERLVPSLLAYLPGANSRLEESE